MNELEVGCTSLSLLTPETEMHLENIKESPHLKKHKSKGRVKSSCKRVFLEDISSSSEEEPDDLQTESWCFEGLVEGEMWENVPVASNNEEQEEQNEGHLEVKMEEDTEQEAENSWARPLTSDDLSSGNSDVDAEVASWSSHQSWSSSSFSKSHSGMILKLRKVYYASGCQGRVSRYQRVMDHSEVRETGSTGKEGCKPRHKKREHGTSKHKKRPPFSSSLHRAKYCPYLSTRHTSKHRRRWVLRSAVQTGKKAGKNVYPDLVGKRIRHLYEENDKTEVWYRGVVLRVHEPHSNPLKTVFEVKYDSEPEWQYYLELLVDYKKGWLKIED